jgi:hypothetical protein
MLRASIVCLWLGAFVLESGTFCQSYVKFFVVPPPGLTPAKQTVPTSLNEHDEIVGYYTFGSGDIPHGFVRAADGTITSFDPPGVPASGGATYAFSINATGAIAGYYLGGVFPFTNHGFVRDPGGNFTTFDPPGSISTIVLSINAGGAITGYYTDLNLLVHGFVRDPVGNFTTFDPPGSTSTKAVGINANGTIIGSYQVADMSVHGFIRQSGGTIMSVDPPGSTGTMVTGINNAEEITGYYTVASGGTFGFLGQSGVPTLVSFTVPGGLGTFPTSINFEGATTGNYNDSGGPHGFVRSPEGIITPFDVPNAPPPEISCFGIPNPTSINPHEVITGSCSTGSPGLPSVIGWVRYP